MGVTQLFRVICLAFVAAGITAPATAKPPPHDHEVAPAKPFRSYEDTGSKVLVGFRPFLGRYAAFIQPGATGPLKSTSGGHVLYSNGDPKIYITLTQKVQSPNPDDRTNALAFIATVYQTPTGSRKLQTVYCLSTLGKNTFNYSPGTNGFAELQTSDNSVTVITTVHVISDGTTCPPPSS